MDIIKATDGKKTYSGAIIAGLTLTISQILKQFDIADDGLIISGTIAGYIVGAVIFAIGIVHKGIKSKNKV